MFQQRQQRGWHASTQHLHPATQHGTAQHRVSSLWNQLGLLLFQYTEQCAWPADGRTGRSPGFAIAWRIAAWHCHCALFPAGTTAIITVTYTRLYALQHPSMLLLLQTAAALTLGCACCSRGVADGGNVTGPGWDVCTRVAPTQGLNLCGVSGNGAESVSSATQRSNSGARQS